MAQLAWIAVLLLFALAGSAAAETVVVRREDCLRLARHVPDPGIAYQPGSDVHGRPVAPADLPDESGGTARMTWVEIALQLPLGTLTPDPPGGLGNSDVTVGVVGVDLLDGSVWLNGQPLDEDAVAAVREACRRATR